MNGLRFEPAKCVRTVTKFSECTSCVEACPVDTLSIAENNLPAFVPSVCVECGGCMGVCPGEAFSLEAFSATEFFFDFAASNESIISCRINVPCIMALGSEHLISLSLVKEELIVDTGHCKECPYKEPLYNLIESSISEANFILEACGSPKRIETKELSLEADESGERAEPADRRAFLKALSLKGAAEVKREFESLVQSSDDEKRVHEVDLVSLAKVRKKDIPDRRKILFTALKRTPKPPIYHTVAEDEISFLSQKYIEQESCTNCQMCYRICPTGALSSNANMSRIYFDAMLCIKCRACHDTCEPDAIKLQPVFEMREFFEPTQRLLASFTIRKCDECGLPFTSLRGEMVCMRCMVEEDEAMELWGLQEDESGSVKMRDFKKED
ncbi:MAG: 4Fe-4S binding protein [Hydrogenimonas sp.]|nr:4Fe-4S binding protein [Hydrogenimonas sp.]